MSGFREPDRLPVRGVRLQPDPAEQRRKAAEEKKRAAEEKKRDAAIKKAEAAVERAKKQMLAAQEVLKRTRDQSS